MIGQFPDKCRTGRFAVIVIHGSLAITDRPWAPANPIGVPNARGRLVSPTLHDHRCQVGSSKTDVNVSLVLGPRLSLLGLVSAQQ
jgi:hypothetical protein